MQCEIFQTTLLGGLAQDEDIPLGPDDDDDFQPKNFAFYGFGQPWQEPPMPHPFNPFNPFVVPNPNNQHLQVMGWDFWPNQNGVEPAQQEL